MEGCSIFAESLSTIVFTDIRQFKFENTEAIPDKYINVIYLYTSQILYDSMCDSFARIT